MSPILSFSCIYVMLEFFSLRDKYQKIFGKLHRMFKNTYHFSEGVSFKDIPHYQESVEEKSSRLQWMTISFNSFPYLVLRLLLL